MPSKGKCEISRYHAHACLPCTISLNKQLVHCNADEYHPIYVRVDNLFYAPIIDSFNDWKIVTFDNLSTIEDLFDDIHKFILNGIPSHIYSVLTLVWCLSCSIKGYYWYSDIPYRKTHPVVVAMKTTVYPQLKVDISKYE